MKKIYYATLDYNGDVIRSEDENCPASIKRFESMGDVEKYLLSGNREDGPESFDEYREEHGLDDDVELHIDTCSDFGDAWIKTSVKPHVVGNQYMYEPFNYNQLSIKAPNENPGGIEYWINPTADIYVLKFKQSEVEK